MTPRIRAKRILSRMSSYHAIETLENDFQSLAEQLLQVANPIGVYVNAIVPQQDVLLISESGVSFESENGRVFVEYKNIERVDVVAGGLLFDADTDGKSDADGLLVLMSDASRKLMPVRNGQGKYRDAFEFARFLSRAAEDVKTAVLQIA